MAFKPQNHHAQINPYLYFHDVWCANHFTKRCTMLLSNLAVGWKKRGACNLFRKRWIQLREYTPTIQTANTQFNNKYTFKLEVRPTWITRTPCHRHFMAKQFQDINLHTSHNPWGNNIWTSESNSAPVAVVVVTSNLVEVVVVVGTVEVVIAK